MIADTVFRMTGHARFGVPGTWRAGSDAVRQILRQQAGVDLPNTIIADGSGLSRHPDRPGNHDCQYIAQHDLNFIPMLPLAGHDAHIAPVFIRPASMVKYRRKPGHCRGFITCRVHHYRQRTKAWPSISFRYAVEPTDQRNRRIPLVRFESRLYKDIYRITAASGCYYRKDFLPTKPFRMAASYAGADPQRFAELALLRRRITTDGTLLRITERWPMSPGAPCWQPASRLRRCTICCGSC